MRIKVDIGIPTVLYYIVLLLAKQLKLVWYVYLIIITARYLGVSV